MLAVKVERAEPPPPDMPDDADLKLLLKACAGKGLWERRDLGMIRVAAATGVRVGELCALELGDVDLMARAVVLRTGNGGRARVARIDPETASAVDRYIRARGRHRLGHLPELWIWRDGPMGISGAKGHDPAPLRAGRRPEDALAPAAPPLRSPVARRRRPGRRPRQARRLVRPTVMRRYGSALATERALAAYDELGGVL